MTLYEGGKIRVRVVSVFLEEFYVKVRIQQGSVTFSFCNGGRCFQLIYQRGCANSVAVL